jgi:hypothetical protein
MLKSAGRTPVKVVMIYLTFSSEPAPPAPPPLTARIVAKRVSD